jgi:hypothetical protein
MTAAQFVKALKDEGLTVDEKKFPNWRTHERDDETGKAFGPVNGVVIHHTAGRNSLNLVYNGTSDLPGPLCHSHLDKNGKVTMISAGRANHAGTFAQNAFDAMLNEAKTHPRPNASEPVDANDRTYGIEIENLGDAKDFYPQTQYDAAVRWATAICRFHGWSADSVIGHKEGTRRKIDPRGPIGKADGPMWDMDTFRKDVAARLNTKTEAPAKPVPAKKPAAGAEAPAYPGRGYFKAGAKNSHVTLLGRQLIQKGYGRFYKVGPGPQWTATDRAAVRAFQVRQGWSGADADGYPGPQTWARLFS